MVQWLRLRTSSTGDVSLIHGLGTKFPNAAGCGQKLKKKKSYFSVSLANWIDALPSS